MAKSYQETLDTLFGDQVRRCPKCNNWHHKMYCCDACGNDYGDDDG